MSKYILDPDQKAKLLIEAYNKYYQIGYEVGLITSSKHKTSDSEGRRAAENLQFFIDSYLEDMVNKDMVVDQDHGFADQEGRDGTT